MIQETAFLSCDNVPDKMRRQFDRPWQFVGEVEATQPVYRAVCRKCSETPRICDARTIEKSVWHAVTLDGYKFVTDDMIEVMVYFGVCDCGAVYWARQGPPFRRVARCLV